MSGDYECEHGVLYGVGGCRECRAQDAIRDNRTAAARKALAEWMRNNPDHVVTHLIKETEK